MESTLIKTENNESPYNYLKDTFKISLFKKMLLRLQDRNKYLDLDVTFNFRSEIHRKRLDYSLYLKHKCIIWAQIPTMKNVTVTLPLVR